MSTLNSLGAISPVDGRYARDTEALRRYFSEYALFAYRVRVEILYFIELVELPLPQLADFDKSRLSDLQDIFLDFNEGEAAKIKEIEKTTRHDIKAVEYYIKDKMEGLGLGAYKEFIHFGLTSQDINNTAIPLSVKEFHEEVYLTELSDMMVLLSNLVDDWSEIPMLARTHGQAASPTRLGKELNVFVERIDQQLRQMRHIPFSAKFGGATGNMNAHFVAYPDYDWHLFAKNFVESALELQRSFPTTQIEHYDNLAAYFDVLKRINTILIDFCRDIWQYISMDYFKQKIKEGEVGSSAMPHKINPIDFENAEGNLGMANGILEFLSAKLPISRLQRDLTDSTVLRNVGVPLAHIMIAFKSIQRGVAKLIVNEEAIEKDLENHYAVIAEAIQTVLRREGFDKPYEMLKDLSRTHKAPVKEDFIRFVQNLNASDELKAELLEITPFNYTGV